MTSYVIILQKLKTKASLLKKIKGISLTDIYIKSSQYYKQRIKLIYDIFRVQKVLFLIVPPIKSQIKGTW